MRKFILAASVALASCLASRAETPADSSYFAAREAAISVVKAAVDAKKTDKAVKKLEDEGLAALLSQLTAMVGPNKPKGYDKGEFSLESLQSGSEGADQLDALVFAKGDNDPRVSVTTEGVASRWLAAQRADPDRKILNLPATLGEALAAPDFYTLAIDGDAAFSLFASVKTSDASTTALLGAFQQDVGPNPPDSLLVSVRRGGLLYIIQAEPEKALKPSPACEAVWKSYEQTAEKAQKAYAASHEKDESQLDAAQKAEGEGDEAFRQCFAKEIKPDDMAALGKQAEQLARLAP